MLCNETLIRVHVKINKRESQDVRGTLAPPTSDSEHLYVYVSKCRTIKSSKLLFFVVFWISTI